MSTQISGEAKGVRSLTEWLAQIFSEDQIEGLDPKFHRALREPAQKLLDVGCDFEAADIAGVDSSPEISALSAAVHLRSVEASEFWGPLLKSCHTGKSIAPLADIQSIARQADTLVGLLTQRPASPIRDEVLRLASEAAERSKKWLPRPGAGAKQDQKSTRYSRGAFEPSEDEEGNGTVRQRRPPQEPRVVPESPLRTFLGWLMTLVVLAAMVFGVWTYSTQPPEPLPVSHYQAFLPEVTTKWTEATELILTVDGGWLEKPEARRIVELQRLLEVGDGTDVYDAIRVLSQEGRVLVEMDSSGSLKWAVDLFPDEQGSRAPAPSEALDGMLKKPLRADEIPLDD